jgi:hypothetical protein
MKDRIAIAATLSCLTLAALPRGAQAFIVDIDRNTGTAASVYLRVGDGNYSGTFINNGTPGSGGGIDTVSVTVPAATLGNGSSLAMTSNASQATSHYDGFVFCNLPAQVYIGGFNRRGRNGAGGAGMLTVTAPSNLTNASGDTIPFSRIRWTSSGNGDGGTQPFPAGSFTGGAQTLANFPVNSWRESCHAFFYANSSVVAAGAYTGRVTYTLTVP